MTTHIFRQLPEIVVIGAGVVGLTTALKIQETGKYQITIIAETFPIDPKNTRYTSHWAGAHHVSLAGDNGLQSELDQETFKVMLDLSAPGSPAEGCFLRIPQAEYYASERSKPSPLEHMPDFEYLSNEELLAGAVSGVAFNTMTIDTPVYLNYLLSRFLGGGGTIVRGTVQHIYQIIEGGAHVFSPSKAYQHHKVDAIVVCAGLGTRTLGGVEDQDMYPIRGQTILIRAPWIKFGRTLYNSDTTWTYIIPRRSGDVIVGGTREENDWFPQARPETTLDILKRALPLCPELAPPEKRENREPTIDDILPNIIEEGCGLRPGRKGGIRLNVEWFEKPNSKDQIPVVYNYGHAGSGFQSSWGSAAFAMKLLEKALART